VPYIQYLYEAQLIPAPLAAEFYRVHALTYKVEAQAPRPDIFESAPAHLFRIRRHTAIFEQDFKSIFGTPRFESLKHAGAHVQRPLWASTSTKNPAYRDVLYAEELIGPDTVDTMPLETIEKFADHGRARNSINDDIAEAKETLAELEKVSIHYDQVTQQLQDEGVQKFADSFHQLFAGIESKKQAIKEGQAAH